MSGIRSLMNLPFTLSSEAQNEIKSDKLPAVSKKAPEFNKDIPNNLVPWLAAVERHFVVADVKKDDSKKFLALSWMEYNTMQEWLENDAVKTGTWKEMKESLLKGYPESSNHERGSKSRLWQLVEDSSLIPRRAYQKLVAYIRAFNLEANKLMKEPAILSNSDAIKYFLHALEDKFRDQILENVEANENNLALAKRRPEDPYTLSEIIHCADDLGKSFVGGMYSMEEGPSGYKPEPSTSRAYPRTKNVPPPKHEHADEWGNKISLSSDKHDLEIRRLEQKVENFFEKDMSQKQAMNSQLDKLVMMAAQNNNQLGMSVNQLANLPTMSAPRMNRFNKQVTAVEYLCFLCNDPSHRMGNCPHLADFLNKGWLVPRNDGTNRVMMKDGGYIPREDGKESRKDKIEKIAKEKGWDQTNAVMFYEEDLTPESVFYTQPAESSSRTSSTPKDPMMQLLAQINNKLDSYETRLGNFEALRDDDIRIYNQNSKNF